MNQKNILVVSLILMCLPSLARAENWHFLARTTKGVDFSMDTGNIARQGNVVSFWELQRNLQEDKDLRLSPSIASMKVKRSINCKTHQVMQLELYEINRNNKEIAHLTAPPSEKYEDIVPHSVNEDEFNQLCH